MKIIKFFAFAAMALSLSLATSCSDDDTQKTLSSECNLETFTLTLSDATEITGVIREDHTIDLTYITPDQDEMMLSAMAGVTVSAGATVWPEPSVAADYTIPVTFIVTAADGYSQSTYKTNPIPTRNSEASIQTFTLKLSDDTEITGVINDDLSIDIPYITPTQDALLQSATAELVLSTGATVTPDGTEALDYTQPQTFTVTAPNGTNTYTYTTHPLATGSSECSLEAFTLKLSDDTEITGNIGDDNTISFSYPMAKSALLQSATAELTLSAGATVDPDPTEAADYTQPITFTVTAADGTTTGVYTTNPTEIAVNVADFTSKSAADMGIDDYNTYKQIGISGDKLVIGTKVFDAKTLEPVGDLNVAGAWTDAGQKLCWLTNDEAGHLVGSFSPSGDPNINPGDGADALAQTSPANIVCWQNGYDQPATLVLNSASPWGQYMSVSGNLVTGDGIVVSLGVRDLTGRQFGLRILDGQKGDLLGNAAVILTNVASNDGSYTQQISPCSSDPQGTWFMYDPSAGSSDIYTWTNQDLANITATPLTGTTGTGTTGWGNYTRGSVKAFTFDGTPYALTLTEGWPGAYASIVGADGTFLMTPEQSGLTLYAVDSGYCAVGTYIYNETDQAGYVYALIPGCEVHVWKITKPE